MPRATILTAVFNCEDYIARSVESALAQTERDIELIVVDDGSTDRTSVILSGFSDPRLKIIRCERGSQTKALNVGLMASASEYVAILDADDLALPDRVRLQADFLDANPGIALVGSGFRPCIDAAGASIRQDRLPVESLEIVDALRRAPHSSMFHSSVMFRKAVIVSLWGYDEDLLCRTDIDLYVRLVGRLKAPCIANLTSSCRSNAFTLDNTSGRRKGSGRVLKACAPPKL
jgi:glycosyltransferase involved in cell wall biosynthesis